MKSKTNNIKAIFPWLYLVFITASFMAPGLIALATRPENNRPTLIGVLFPLIPVAFAFFGTLIISRQPGNRIGLLMLLPTLSFFPLVDAYQRPFIEGLAPLPQTANPAFLLLLWFSNWNWILFVFPAIFMILLFPTGLPLNPRWNWLVYLGLFLAALLPVSAAFSKDLGDAAWAYPNPVGFLDVELIGKIFTPFYFIFPAWIILCVISLFVRFHRAKAVEREQIKWLFYAAALFAACYVPTFFQPSFGNMDNIWGLLFAVGMLAFPAATGIAILRHRLYDIDVIIRRTLQYTLLTGLLSLVYFGGVAMLQTIVGVQSSPAVIVATTLAIAALFNPLRKRIQDFIDRRFYRRKYDAEKALAEFAEAARSETDLATLSNKLIAVVQETVQPEFTGLWIAHRQGSLGDGKH